MKRLWVMLLVTVGACAAPERSLRHRSPLLAPPEARLTPEGRPSHVPSAPEQETGPERGRGELIAKTAAGYLGKTAIVANGRRFPSDCVGFVRAVYASYGIDLFAEGGEPGDNGVNYVYRYASKHGLVHDDEARPGDIVFFRETYDRNRDGRENDGLTHVGIVESVEGDGTVSVVHRVARGVVRYRMNLDRPHDRKDPATGRVVNDYLREGPRARLAGELFASYGTLVR